MATQIFVNIPVKDLNRSIEFFTKLGFTFNAQFTDEKATCMIVSDTIYFMLLTEPFFKTFTEKEIGDPKQKAQAIFALSAESRAAVDETIAKAKAAGATIPKDPSDDGWMYGNGFEDLDGHLWEVLYMDETQIPKS